jgi:hypothetical protein
LKDISKDGKISKMEWDVSLDWIVVALHGDRCRTLVNAVTNLRVPYNEGNFFDWTDSQVKAAKSRTSGNQNTN